MIVSSLNRILITAVAAVLLFLSGTSMVHAHVGLASSSPQDGSELSSPPSAVELTFNEQLLPDTVEIAVTSEVAGLIAGPEFTTSGSSVQVNWPQDLPNDTYTVAYRVVSNDGHPVTGAISFSFTGSGAPAIVEPEIVEPEIAKPEIAEPETTGIAPVWLIVGGLVIGTAIGYIMWRRASRRASG